MADQSRTDLCVIGAGALGIALAEHARALGATVTLVDRGFPEPGDGPQRSLRLASLAASASLASGFRRAADFGLANIDPKIRMKEVQERAVALEEKLSVLTSSDRLNALGIDYVRGETCFADANSLLVGGVQIKARNFVLALGAPPVLPGIPGLDQIDYFTPDTIVENTRKLTHLLVIGGDATAVSLAQTFVRLGSAVTLVPQGLVLPGIDRETADILVQALAEEGVRILDGAEVGAIVPRAQGTGAIVRLPSGEEEALDLSHVLVASGRRVDLAALGADKARLNPARGATDSYVHGSLGQTSNRRVRLAGLAAGLDQWQHAISHGRALIEDIVLGAPVENPASQPQRVLTEPALVQIGKMSPRAEKFGLGQVLRVNLAENEQALALGADKGLLKAALAPDGTLAGASIVGQGAAEMAGLLTLAMEHRIAPERLRALSLPHPGLLVPVARLGEAAAALRPISARQLRLRAMMRQLMFWKR